jgi:hypothetical protein
MSASEPPDLKAPSFIKMLVWGLLAILVGIGLPALVLYMLYGRYVQPE